MRLSAMVSNTEAAELLRSIADLLDLQGEQFKPEAYRRAARSIESLPEPLSKYADRGELRAIPGIGEAISEKLTEFLATGRLGYLDQLRAEIPTGVVQLMRLPGIGPKTARRLWIEFQVESPSALRTAIDAGRLSGAKGFGERKIAQFREAAGARPAGARTPIAEAWPRAQRLVAAIRERLTGEERAESPRSASA
ncbi:MAG: helix-hairpin-helix domain-containing protein [Thermoplasmatales archaeon]|nr:helix-hairpin-helix domain-containing protein [Thermoplasmatales archaeon]